jgi:hypothetical protein
MSAPIIGLYPRSTLPTFEQQSLTADDWTMLQCAYIWLRTYDTRGTMPPTATASYSELWFMLQYMMQLQILYRDICRIMPAYVDAHRARYTAAAGGLPISFDNVLRHDFWSLREAVCGLAQLQFNEPR